MTMPNDAKSHTYPGNCLLVSNKQVMQYAIYDTENFQKNLWSKVNSVTSLIEGVFWERF